MGQENINFEKLNGRSNFSTWEKKMLSFLRTRDLYKCVQPAPNTEKDEDKLSRAVGWIFLACEDHVTHHFGKDDSPLQIWELLRKTYAESGQGLHLQAVMTLSHTYRAECDTNDEYIGRMMEAWRRCTEVGIVFQDNIVALFMVGNLGPDYESFRQSLIGSGQKITVERVKSGLLELTPMERQNQSTAFYSEKKPIGTSGPKKVKCFGCGKVGHYRNKCPKRASGSGNREAADSADARYASAFLVSSKKYQHINDWYLDSGASCHMTARREILCNFRTANVQGVLVADNRKLDVVGVGTVCLSIDGREITLKDVLYVPKLKANLMSLDAVSRSNHRIELEDGVCRIFSKPEGMLVIEAKSSGGTYKVDASDVRCALAVNAESGEWHRRMGHLSFGGLKRIQKADENFYFTDTRESINNCVSCAEGKQARSGFRKKQTTLIKSQHILELVHADLCGPMSVSLGGAKYFAVFVDDFSRKVFVSFLAEKSALVPAFRDFVTKMENQTGMRVKRLRSDNGREFVNHEMDKFCKEKGIVHETTVPYTPQQNGVSERMNRTLIERARCMLHDSKADKRLWAEAVNHAAHLVNRSVNRSLGNRIPEEIWTGSKPDLSSLRTFGEQAMVCVPNVKRTKWDPKAVKMIFVGYTNTDKNLRFYHSEKEKICVTRDAKFINKNTNKKFIVNTDDVSDEAIPSVGEISKPMIETQKPESESSDDGQSEFADAVTSPTNTPRRSLRTKRPVRREDFVSYFTRDCDAEDPEDIEEASKAHDATAWENAMKEEIYSFDQNQSWTLMELPQGRKPIKTKWVFKRKHGEDGSVIRHKARLVAKGCSQQPGIDYKETFSPVVRYESIRLLIALAAQNGMEIDQMDAVSAYLQGPIEEEIYVQQPEGFDDGSGRVYRLNKAMYGLKQSGRCWNNCLDNALKSFGLKKSAEDPCVYHNKESSIFIAIYVDDILVFWKDANVRDNLKLKLASVFQMKDMGKARTCVGMTIAYDKEYISINQTRYTEEVLERFGMRNCKAVASPCDISQKLSARSDDEREINVPYREAVGALLFLVQGTRPDLAFAVSNVSRFNDRHNETHWTAVKRIFRYLRGTTHLGIVYRRGSGEPVTGFVDADWANDQDERRSFSGYVFKLAEGAVAWSCKRQQCVAVSSTEAEYAAIAHAAKEAVWLFRFIRQFSELKTVLLHCDNQSALIMTEREAFSPRTKHIDVSFHFVRDLVKSGLLTMKYVPSTNNLADCLTKGVCGPKMMSSTIGFGMKKA